MEKEKKEEKKRKNVIILSADMLGSSQPFQLLNFELGSIVYLKFLAEQSFSRYIVIHVDAQLFHPNQHLKYLPTPILTGG